MRCVADLKTHPEEWITGPAALCQPCLRGARRDIMALVRDYADLENVLADTGGLAERVAGTRERSIPLALGVDMLQRDIWHFLTTWEEITIEVCRLSAVPAGKTRDGWAVQRAVRILLPRLDTLAAIGPHAIFPAGPDNPPEDMTGAQAILTMRALHRRIGQALGRASLRHILVGPCWKCGIDGGLRRDDGDETVYCAFCTATSTWDTYHRDVIEMVAKTRAR